MAGGFIVRVVRLLQAREREPHAFFVAAGLERAHAIGQQLIR